MKRIRAVSYVLLIGGLLSSALLFVPNTSAYTPSNVQGYAADAPIDIGTIVRLNGKNANRVAVASQAELQNMFGVVVDRSQLPITLSNGGIDNETFVAVSGTYQVLVSTQGGAIANGDYVTL